MTVTLKEFLRREVKPALGCTEPGAVALAVARACDELSDRGEVASVRVTVSTSIYKNGMAVGIPGTRGARGNAIAAALGALCGRSERGLEVLDSSTALDVAKAESWVADERVTIYCDPDRNGVYVLATVFTPTQKVTCLIEKSHANIVRVTVDGAVVFEAPQLDTQDSGGLSELPETLAGTLALADAMDDDDAAFLWQGIEMNLAVAEGGLKSQEACAECGECVQGSRFGRATHRMMERGVLAKDVANEIRSVCSAAADARMSGILMPVMSSAGSGNHGITAVIPIAILGKKIDASRRDIAKAVAVSHLATSFVKRSLGRLSPVCGCSIAAGAGAAAGLTDLLGGGVEQISSAMKLILANLTGMLCDGAKESCALKVGSAASEAYFAANWAVAGEVLAIPQGLVGETIEETVRNAGRVQMDGMKTVDRLIIDILDERYRPR